MIRRPPRSTLFPLHDALPIWVPRNPSMAVLTSPGRSCCVQWPHPGRMIVCWSLGTSCVRDRKSTRLNSSHSQISYAVFCLKKKKTLEKQALCVSEADLHDIVQ